MDKQPGRPPKRKVNMAFARAARTSPPDQQASSESIPLPDAGARNLRMRPAVPVNYKPPSKADKPPYSEMLGTTSNALQVDVKRLWDVIDELSAGDHDEQRSKELVEGFMSHPRTQPLIPVPEHYRLLSYGVSIM